MNVACIGSVLAWCLAHRKPAFTSVPRGLSHGSLTHLVTTAAACRADVCLPRTSVDLCLGDDKGQGNTARTSTTQTDIAATADTVDGADVQPLREQAGRMPRTRTRLHMRH